MDYHGESGLFIPRVNVLSHVRVSRTLEEKRKILQGKLDPTQSRVECVVLTPQDKREVFKLTQEIRFAIEVAMVSRVGFALAPVTNDPFSSM